MIDLKLAGVFLTGKREELSNQFDDRLVGVEQRLPIYRRIRFMVSRLGGFEGGDEFPLCKGGVGAFYFFAQFVFRRKAGIQRMSDAKFYLIQGGHIRRISHHNG